MMKEVVQADRIVHCQSVVIMLYSGIVATYKADFIVYMQDMGLLRAHDAQCFALVVPCACHVLRDRRQLTVANGAAVSRFEAASG